MSNTSAYAGFFFLKTDRRVARKELRAYLLFVFSICQRQSGTSIFIFNHSSTFSFVILSCLTVFIFYTSRFSDQHRCSIAISAGSGEHRSGENRDYSEWGVQMSTRGIARFQYTKKILLVDKEKAKYCYLTFSLIISFFGDIFSPKRLTSARATIKTSTICFY